MSSSSGSKRVGSAARGCGAGAFFDIVGSASETGAAAADVSLVSVELSELDFGLGRSTASETDPMLSRMRAAASSDVVTLTPPIFCTTSPTCSPAVACE